MKTETHYVEVTLRYFKEDGTELPDRRTLTLQPFELHENRPVSPVYGRVGDPEIKGFEPSGPHTFSLKGVVLDK